jgi:hypothetical protein
MSQASVQVTAIRKLRFAGDQHSGFPRSGVLLPFQKLRHRLDVQIRLIHKRHAA